MIPNWEPNEPGVDPKLTRNGGQMGQKWARNCPEMGADIDQNGFEIDPKWEPEWTRNGSEMDPNWQQKKVYPKIKQNVRETNIF